jgi:aryl-alcohol dehydrogenase-like predicted oxidoreductase
MEYRHLGKTGLTVSELCLGAMTFGREASEKQSVALLDRFVEAGGSFIDTADVYSRGLSEEILGRWLKTKDRDDFVIATKVRFGTDDPADRRPNRFGLSRKHIMAAVDASLRRLQTDHIDLYQVHNWDPVAPLEETLSTLNDVVRAGKARYIGASNYTGWQLQKAIDISRANGWEHFVCLQPLYNLLDRELEWELLPLCRSEGLGVIPWSPLRGGWLSGKFHRGMEGPPAGTRIEKADAEGWSESWSRYANEHSWVVIDALLAVGEEAGKSPAQVALRWLMQQPGVTAPIIGARNTEQLESNLGAAGWSLSDDQLKRLTEASDKPLPYPYETHERLGLRS